MDASEIQIAQTLPEYQHLLGQRLGIKNPKPQEHLLYQDAATKHVQLVGSVRYVGKIFNNPKAGEDIWIGVEWDLEAHQGGPGKHQGTVDGYKYFDCENHNQSELWKSGQSKSCSFVRYSKVQIGGIPIDQAIKEQYLPDQDKDQETLEAEKKKLAEDLFVTGAKGKKLNIEMVGMDMAQDMRADISQSREIALQFLRISDIGVPGTLRNLIPNTMTLHLDKNFLYSWDQFFQITQELDLLKVLVLTGNKFRKIDKTYFDGKNIEELTPMNLSELVLIDCSLEWSQIDILAPTLVNVNYLYLARNNCNKICSEFEIKGKYWENLSLLNLEQNGIESWDELSGFRVLESLQKLIVNKNMIKEIYYEPGFKWLKYLSFEDNLISEWHTFNQLNKFDGFLKLIRCSGNPLFKIDENLSEEETMSKKKQNEYGVIGRVAFLNSLNGTKIQELERKDAEIYYLHNAYLTYMRDILQPKLGPEATVENLEDPGLLEYVTQNHPRFLTLADIFGSPIGVVSLKSQKNNIAKVAAKIELISEVQATQGKVLTKKLLLTMTVTQLKAMCSKLFKVDLLKLDLHYRGLEDTQDYPLDEEFRQLSFYSMADGGKIMVKEL